jgi:hypothetical protein
MPRKPGPPIMETMTTTMVRCYTEFYVLNKSCFFTLLALYAPCLLALVIRRHTLDVRRHTLDVRR